MGTYVPTLADHPDGILGDEFAEAVDDAFRRVSAGSGVSNGKIVESHAGNAVTFALKTMAGSDPSAADSVVVSFADNTSLEITSALSLTITSGSTLGTSNSTPFRVWAVIINDSGIARLGVRQCTSSAGISGFPGNGILTSTAEGGAGGADSAGVTYTGTAVTAKPYVVAAFAEYDSGLATAGTWNASPTRIVKFITGTPRPGDEIQTQIATHATSESTTSTTYVDTSLTKSITPTSACNPVSVTFFATNGQSTANKWAFYVVRRGGTPIGNDSGIFSAGGTFVNKMTEGVFDRPGAASAQTYTLAYKTDSGGDAFLCTSNLGSTLVLTEKMG